MEPQDPGVEGMSPRDATFLRRTPGRLRGLLRSPGRWPLFGQPVPLRAYVLAVLGGDLALFGWALAHTGARAGELLLFGSLLACGAVCIEATRRLGMPAGVSRDLLSAWWLPVALLLPPLFALLAPVPLGLLLQLRVRRGPVFRRVFSSAALGIAGAVASATFHAIGAVSAGDAALVRSHAWLTDPAIVAAAVACAVLFTIVNMLIVVFAAHLADRQTPWRGLLWDRERLLLDVAELCVGVLVTIACLASTALLLVALPPVVVLQRSLLHKQLRAAARIDAKTGLLNAAAWQREADIEIGRALRAGDSLAVLLIDIDYFKRVNDSCGHLVGDQVLAELSATLLHLVRGSDLVGRFGGEEFVALLPKISVVEACQIAERVRIRVSESVVAVHDMRVTVTVSIGVAMLGTHGRDLFELLAAADLALYRAKRAGRDRICLFNGGFNGCTPTHGDGGSGEQPEAAGR